MKHNTKKNKEEAFTGGDWKISHNPLSKNTELIIEGDNKLIARIVPEEVEPDEQEANAALIAEAKNMYEIVKTVSFWFGNEANYPKGTNGYRINQDAEAIINRINPKQ